jgi:hypothetical protein
MPRVKRRKRRAHIEGRPLTYREYLHIRMCPEYPWPDWAVDQVRRRLKRFYPPEQLEAWLKRRPATVDDVEVGLRRIGADNVLAWWFENRANPERSAVNPFDRAS